LGLPRYLTFAGRPVNAYKVFLAVGIWIGTISTAALADSSGQSPLRVGLAAMLSGLAGLIGARFYHVLMHPKAYFSSTSKALLWDSTTGGLSVFGALITFVPTSYAAASLVHIPSVALWDYMAIGVLAGGFFIRLGCVFNGCCMGRETAAAFGVRLHDTHGTSKRRVPVQFMEMAWWLLGLLIFLIFWPHHAQSGSYALGVLAWYGVGRFFLEPLREAPDVIYGRIRINQLVAALIAFGGATTLLLLNWHP
jgi:prolipoprotein diacylglyceryltransferase